MKATHQVLEIATSRVICMGTQSTCETLAQDSLAYEVQPIVEINVIYHQH